MDGLLRKRKETKELETNVRNVYITTGVSCVSEGANGERCKSEPDLYALTD